MLHRIEYRNLSGESPNFVSLNIPFLVKGTKEVSLTRFLYSDCSEWAILWSIVLTRIDLVSLYFHLLWYHSILRGSLDQKHSKTNEICRQNSEIHSAFPCSRWPPWFPDLFRPYGSCVKRGSGKHIFSLSLFSLSCQSNISTSCEVRFKYPLPWENKISQMPYPRANKDNQIPTPCPASPSSGMILIAELFSRTSNIVNDK